MKGRESMKEGKVEDITVLVEMASKVDSSKRELRERDHVPVEPDVKVMTATESGPTSTLGSMSEESAKKDSLGCDIVRSSVRFNESRKP